MVQRYSTDELYPEVYEDETGPLVKYEDYAALELKLLAAHSHIERAITMSPNKKDGYIKMAMRELE